MAAEIRALSNFRSASGFAPSRDDVKRDLLLTLLFTLIHLPLGLILYNAGSLGVIHPLFVIGFGLYVAIRRRSKYSDIALVLAYITGVEVLWRMGQVPVFWEIGKYGSILIILAAVIRRARWEIPKLPLLYLLLLIPGCILTVLDSDFSSVQGLLSFNMSGPLYLFFACWFFFRARINPIEFRRLLIAMIIPLLCVAFTSFFYTVSAENITFTNSSNFETSGGFGPNQVSALLGLGVFVACAGAVLIRKGTGFSLFFGLSALFLASVCVLTFSRGGIYNAVGGISILLLFGLRNTAAGLQRIALVLAAIMVFVFLIFPVANDFTGGKLQTRFEDTGTTNRSEIALSDLMIFVENPLFGVGVGASRGYREKFIDFAAASHTEFSRLISEHGLFGIGSLLALAGTVWINFRRRNSKSGKAFIVGGFAWSFFFMLNSGMRLGAPSFMWGLGFVWIVNAKEMFSSLPWKLGSVKNGVFRRQPVRVSSQTNVENQPGF